MSGSGSTSNIILTVIIVLVLAVIGYRFLMPLLTRKVYEARIDFEITGEATYEGQNYYTGGSLVGTFQLKEGQKLIIETLETPADGSNLHYTNVFLRKHETNEVVDIAKLTIINPSKLTAPQEDVYLISLGVTKSILYKPDKSTGLWVFKIKKEVSRNLF